MNKFIKGTKNNDTVKVSQNRDGSLLVNFNGEDLRYSPNEAEGLYFDLGEGNNILMIDDDISYNFNIRVGNGDNNIKAASGNDIIIAGNGNNNINAGAGNDKVFVGIKKNGLSSLISPSKGNNIIYGGPGNDYLQGGPGDDMISGGDGDDIIYGLDGDDIINGGPGDDYINAGNGDDNIEGGLGNDIIFSGKGYNAITDISGKNTIANNESIKGIRVSPLAKNKIYQYNKNAYKLGKRIKINGSKAFKMLVQSDLEALRALPCGREILKAIDKSVKTVLIKELDSFIGNSFSVADNYNDAWVKEDGIPNKGTNVKIFYNPSFIKTEMGEYEYFSSLVVLYHELVHAYNFITGTVLPGEMPHPCGGSVSRLEYQAIGLDIEGGIEDIKYSDGNTSKKNPHFLTENDIREQLGLKIRKSY